MNVIDFVENDLGLKLLPYQKEVLRKTSTIKQPLVITMPRGLGYSNSRLLAYLASICLTEGDSLDGKQKDPEGDQRN